MPRFALTNVMVVCNHGLQSTPKQITLTKTVSKRNVKMNRILESASVV